MAKSTRGAEVLVGERLAKVCGATCAVPKSDFHGCPPALTCTALTAGNPVIV